MTADDIPKLSNAQNLYFNGFPYRVWLASALIDKKNKTKFTHVAYKHNQWMYNVILSGSQYSFHYTKYVDYRKESSQVNYRICGINKKNN